MKKGDSGRGLTRLIAFVNELGGSIYVSTKQGNWTVFSLWFPVAEDVVLNNSV